MYQDSAADLEINRVGDGALAWPPHQLPFDYHNRDPGPGEKAIPLRPESCGLFMIVSESRYDAMAERNWKRHFGNDKSRLYAATTGLVTDGPWHQKTILAHRYLAGVLGVPELFVDHRQYGGLYNTDGNLRVCTQGENLLNIPVQGSVPFRGVWARESAAREGGAIRYRAQVRIGGNAGYPYFSKVCDSAEEAARVRDDVFFERLLTMGVQPSFILQVLNFPERYARQVERYARDVAEQDLLDEGATARVRHDLKDIPF